MKLLYNPIENREDEKGNLIPLGADIGDANDPKKSPQFNQVAYSHKRGEIKQYEDDVAVFMLETFGFLQDLSPTQAKELTEKLKLPFKCKYCNSSFGAEIALRGHSRTHKAEMVKEVVEDIDPNLIPKAEGQPIPFMPYSNIPQMQKPSNPDRAWDEATGSGFYGEGFQEKKGI